MRALVLCLVLTVGLLCLSCDENFDGNIRYVIEGKLEKGGADIANTDVFLYVGVESKNDESSSNTIRQLTYTSRNATILSQTRTDAEGKFKIGFPHHDSKVFWLEVNGIAIGYFKPSNMPEYYLNLGEFHLE